MPQIALTIKFLLKNHLMVTWKTIGHVTYEYYTGWKEKVVMF